MITNHSTRAHRAGHSFNVRTIQGGLRMPTAITTQSDNSHAQPANHPRRGLSRSARRTLSQLAAMRSYRVSVAGRAAASRNAALVKAVHAIGGQDLREAREALRWPWGFCFQCRTAEEADALQRRLVAAGAVCTVEYVDAYGNPVREDVASEAA